MKTLLPCILSFVSVSAFSAPPEYQLHCHRISLRDYSELKDYELKDVSINLPLMNEAGEAVAYNEIILPSHKMISLQLTYSTGGKFAVAFLKDIKRTDEGRLDRANFVAKSQYSLTDGGDIAFSAKAESGKATLHCTAKKLN
jgi:hypothetical protein